MLICQSAHILCPGRHVELKKKREAACASYLQETGINLVDSSRESTRLVGPIAHHPSLSADRTEMKSYCVCLGDLDVRICTYVHYSTAVSIGR